MGAWHVVAAGRVHGVPCRVGGATCLFLTLLLPHLSILRSQVTASSFPPGPCSPPRCRGLPAGCHLLLPSPPPTPPTQADIMSWPPPSLTHPPPAGLQQEGHLPLPPAAVRRRHRGLPHRAGPQPLALWRGGGDGHVPGQLRYPTPACLCVLHPLRQLSTYRSCVFSALGGGVRCSWVCSAPLLVCSPSVVCSVFFLPWGGAGALGLPCTLAGLLTLGDGVWPLPPARPPTRGPPPPPCPQATSRGLFGPLSGH